MRQLPTAFPDTLASGCGEFYAVSATDRAASADSFVPCMSLPMFLHLFHSTHCHFYVPTTAKTALLSPATNNHIQHTTLHVIWK